MKSSRSFRAVRTLWAVALMVSIVAVWRDPAPCMPNVGAHCAADQDCAQCADVCGLNCETKVRTAEAVECRHAVCQFRGFDPCAPFRALYPPVTCTPNVGGSCVSDQDCAQCADVPMRNGCHVTITTLVDCVDSVCKTTGCPVERCPQGQVCVGCSMVEPCACVPRAIPSDASPRKLP
jgi:hypothetical protein